MLREQAGRRGEQKGGERRKGLLDPCAAKKDGGRVSSQYRAEGRRRVGPLAVRSGLATGPCFHPGSRVLLEANESPYRPSGSPLLAEYKFSLSPFVRHPT